MRNEKNTIISSLLWKFFERLATQGVQFVVSIILARLLLPEDYGIVTMLLVFTSIANVFVQTGFSTALVQKKDADDLDFSSAFYVSLALALIFYLLLYILAPVISNFYNMPAMTSILRAISVILFFGAVSSVQNAKISKDMKFKKLFFSSLIAVLISGTTGIIMAYNGYGAWALVGQQIANELATCIVLWFTSGWKPKLIFSYSRTKELFSYGWKILSASLIDAIYRNVYNLTIGKVYNSKTLGNYNKGEQFPKLIAVNVDNTINSVMLSALSKEQDDKEKIKSMTRRSMKVGAFIIFPMMIGLAAVSKSLVIILLTNNWIGCVPYMQLLCIVYALYPLCSTNMQAVKALGRSDYHLKVEIAKKTLGIIALLLTLKSGVMAIVVGQVIVAVISLFISWIPNRKLINYKLIELIKDLAPSIAISLIMYICVYFIAFVKINIFLTLILQIISGIAIYFVIAYIFKVEPLIYLLSIIKHAILKNKKGNQ